MKLLFVGTIASVSGAEVALERLLPGLSDNAISIILTEDGPMVARYQSHGANVLLLRSSERLRQATRHFLSFRSIANTMAILADAMRLILSIRREVRRSRPDFVFGNNLRGSTFASIACFRSGTTFVWMARDRLDTNYVTGLSRLIYRSLIVLFTDGIVANSEGTLATLPVRGKAILVQNDPLPEKLLSLEPRDEFINHPMCIGIVGRIAQWKGQELFLRAFALAFPEGDSRALIVGGDTRGESVTVATLKELACELGILTRVTFAGAQDDVEEFYSRMDIFCHCSLIPEPFGQVVAEAMASGVPVIVPNVGGPAELSHGGSGFTYEIANAKSLSTAMQTLSCDSDLRHSLASKGRRRVSELRPEVAGQRILTWLNEKLVKAPEARRFA